MKQDLFKYLPSDIIINILSRLPVRIIAICKCVCKSWLDLLATDDFVSGVSAYMRAPSIVFIDKIEPHIVNQLMPCMDEAYSRAKPVHHDADSESSNCRPGYLLVIGATNRPDSLDPALQQWFDCEIAIPDPDKKARLDILSALTRNLKVQVGFDLARIATCSLGFVAGDLVALVKEACKVALSRRIDGIILQPNKEQNVEVQLKDCYRQPFSDEDLEHLSIIMSDFLWKLDFAVEDYLIVTVPIFSWLIRLSSLVFAAKGMSK